MANAARYKAILAEVAQQLETEPGSELCKHVAMLRMVRDNMTSAAIRGERVAVADVRELDAALKAYLPERETLQLPPRKSPRARLVYARYEKAVSVPLRMRARQ
jgi:predicted RNA-binding Zn ribbon-like protein